MSRPKVISVPCVLRCSRPGRRQLRPGRASCASRRAPTKAHGSSRPFDRRRHDARAEGRADDPARHPLGHSGRGPPLLHRLDPQRRRRLAGDEHALERRRLAQAVGRFLPRVDVDRHDGQGAGDLGHRRGPRPQQRLRRDALPAQHRARRGARSGADDTHRPRDRRAGSGDRASPGPSRRPLRSCRTRAGAGPTKATAPIPRWSAPTPRRWSRGLQGKLGSSTSVLATAKHWLGDGGTFHGKDQGETRTSEAKLIRTHAAGYYGALKAQRADGDGQLFELHRHRDRQALGQDARQRASGRPTSSRSGSASTAWWSATGTASSRFRAAPSGTARRRSTPGSTW